MRQQYIYLLGWRSWGSGSPWTRVEKLAPQTKSLPTVRNENEQAQIKYPPTVRNENSLLTLNIPPTVGNKNEHAQFKS